MLKATLAYSNFDLMGGRMNSKIERVGIGIRHYSLDGAFSFLLPSMVLVLIWALAQESGAGPGPRFRCDKSIALDPRPIRIFF